MQQTLYTILFTFSSRGICGNKSSRWYRLYSSLIVIHLLGKLDIFLLKKSIDYRLHIFPPGGVQPTLQMVHVLEKYVVVEVKVVVSQYWRNLPCLSSEAVSSIPDST